MTSVMKSGMLSQLMGVSASISGLGEKKNSFKDGDDDDDAEDDAVNGWDMIDQKLLQVLAWTDLQDSNVRNELTSLVIPVKTMDVEKVELRLTTPVKLFHKMVKEVKLMPAVIRWIVTSNGLKGSKSIWLLPDSETVMERRGKRFVQLILFSHQKYNKKYDDDDDDDGIDLGADDMISVLKKVLDDSPHIFKLSLAGKKSVIELFLQACFCCINSRRLGGLAKPVVGCLIQIAQDVIWIFGLYSLYKLKLESSDECITESDLILSTTCRCNAYGVLKVILKQASLYDKSNKPPSMPRVIPLSSVFGSNVSVDGVLIGNDFLFIFWNRLVSETSFVLQSLLSSGESKFSYPTITIDQCIDSRTDCQLGSFGRNFILESPQDSHMSSHDFQQHILTTMLHNLQNDSTLFCDNHWIKDGLQSWMRKADTLMELFCVSIHLGGGGPSRAPDIETLSICNSASKQRNMFFLKGQGLVSLVVPSKTKKVRGGMRKPVVKKFPMDFSNMMLKYVVLLRPFHCFFSTILFGKKKHLLFPPQVADIGSSLSSHQDNVTVVFGSHLLVHQ
jgi:hypothetical protein